MQQSVDHWDPCPRKGRGTATPYTALHTDGMGGEGRLRGMTAEHGSLGRGGKAWELTIECAGQTLSMALHWQEQRQKIPDGEREGSGDASDEPSSGTYDGPAAQRPPWKDTGRVVSMAAVQRWGRG